ncbi:MAG TPA: phosphodiester glycosidase family protein, partial [Chloroflexota bacterium]
YWLSQSRPLGAAHGRASLGPVATIKPGSTLVAPTTMPTPAPPPTFIAVPSPLPGPPASITGTASPFPQPTVSAPLVLRRAMHIPVAVHRSLPPALTIPPSWPATSGEGIWQPAGRLVGGQTALERTFVLPDPQRPYAEVDLVWLDPQRTMLHLAAGSQYPTTSAGLHGSGEVPAGQRSGLLAAFNGGFKLMTNQYGSVGFRAAGQWFTSPTVGMATVAIDASGRVMLGAWGSEVPASPLPSDLRQNLPLILDQGRISPQIDDGAAWGTTVDNNVRVWRSGLGQTADGALIYAAGTPLTARGLAEAIRAAGAQRAMELDINSYWVSFNFVFPNAPGSTQVHGETLMPAMERSADRYLTPDERDFFYVTTAG